MAFAATGLRCIVDRIGGGPAVWYYSSTDPHTDMDADNYFTAGVSSYGMKTHDVVICVDTDSATCTIHSVRASVDGTAGSINQATLS
jgi:hypothetical protein